VAQPLQLTSFAVAKLSIATDHMAIAASQPLQPAKSSWLQSSTSQVRNRRNQLFGGCKAEHRNRRNRPSRLSCDAFFATIATG
jgi:hypothetical protein